MGRSVSILTAVAWALLLSLLFALGQRVNLRVDAISVINDGAVFIMFGVVAAAAYFTCRPRLWLALLLLIPSISLAYLSAYAVWSHIAFCRTWSEYLSLLVFSRHDQLYLAAAVLFVTLALLWIVVCWRLRHIASKT